MRNTQPKQQLGLAIAVHWLHQLARATGLNRLDVCAALSGGCDSSVLLHLLHAARSEPQSHVQFTLKAVHVHHGLSPNADQWARHCRALCRNLDIPLSVRKVNVSRAVGSSLEEQARLARYAVFRQQKAPVLALAQHANDQAETVLLQMLRGAGPKGMAGMGSLARLAGLSPEPAHWLWRPLLGVSRPAIERYAILHDIKWIEDESNVNENLSRNRLRKRVMPALEAAFPQALSTIGRSARNLADAALLCQDLADMDLANARLSASKLAVPALQPLPTHRLKNLLRRWLEGFGLRAPSETRLSALVQALYQTNNDTRLTWIHDGWQIERKKGELCAVPK